MKRDAVLDTSFWINAYRIEIYWYLPRYFDVAHCSRVKEEIEVEDPKQPAITYPDTQAFRVFCEGGLLAHRDPKKYETVFGDGEAQSMALAKQDGRLLLIDDFHAAIYAADVLQLQTLDSAGFLLRLFKDQIFSIKGALYRLDRLEKSLSPNFLDPVREAIELIAPRRKGGTK